LIAALNARVFDLSRGTVVLTPGDEAEFKEPLPRTLHAAFWLSVQAVRIGSGRQSRMVQ
jgi:hypothetical protein